MRSVIEILQVINETFDGFLGEVPSYNTVGNWIKKYGLDTYNLSGESHKGKGYAQVVDESMMIGSEKLLVTLGIPSTHPGCPLCHSDVSILDLSISSSWTGERIKTQLHKASQKVGHLPEYVISDNASTMNKAIRLFGICHHRDISHSLGMYLERTYKNASDFNAFVKSMADVKIKNSMKKVAYLLPPTQRTIARFINLSNWVKWAHKISNEYHTLTTQEKEIFSFIPANASLIDELWEVMRCVEGIESICKHEGLSRASLPQCQLQIRRNLIPGNTRMRKLADEILGFLKTETEKLPSDEDVRNNSSDIIESIFGTYKARKSTNKLHGVTTSILLIPARSQLMQHKDAKRFLFKERLERVYLKDINVWAVKNLSPNLVTKRANTLKNAG